MTDITAYQSHIYQATILDCLPAEQSLFSNNEQRFHVVVEVRNNETEAKKHKFIVSEREKDIVLEKTKVGDTVIVLEEYFDDVEHNDIIIENESILKNDAVNVARVNQYLNHQKLTFDESIYESYYNAFEYTYERMTETVKENIDTIYLFFNTLAQLKNGQTIRTGAEQLIKESIEVALKADIPFEKLMAWLDLSKAENIKTYMNNADAEMRASFFKQLVATKAELKMEEQDIFGCFKNLKITQSSTE